MCYSFFWKAAWAVCVVVATSSFAFAQSEPAKGDAAAKTEADAKGDASKGDAAKTDADTKNANTKDAGTKADASGKPDASSKSAAAKIDTTGKTDGFGNPLSEPGGKAVLLSVRITRVPDGNDFNDPDSEYCFKHSKASKNMVLFWAKEYGDDPATNAVANRRFNVDASLKECERFYDYYTDTLKWVDKEKSYASKYKFLIFVIGGSGGTAFGGSVDNNIGALWTPATRINRQPYGVIAHELGHSFQAIGRADGASSFSGGSIHEMTSQYMLWQVYPEWQTFENYHLNDFMFATHLAFLHEDNQYHSPYVLEYWSNKHGLEFIGKLWREVKRGEDPVMTYKRITSITQDQFNDEIFDAAPPLCHLGYAAHRKSFRPLRQPAHHVAKGRGRWLVSDCR